MSSILTTMFTRRRFLQASGATGAVAVGSGSLGKLVGLTATTTAPQTAAAATGSWEEAEVTKNICHQCPARCGIDVYTHNGRVVGIYGDAGNPIANGRLCPKGHLGSYFLYDPDRFKGPMKRTNPNKGRDEDPGWEPISWEEAYEEIAERINELRANGEAHKFAHFYGRGWGSSDAGLYGDWGKLVGTPNAAIGHSSICADGSKRAKAATDGNNSYNSYDYANTNYILNFGAGFLEAFRPYNYLMQMWGHMRTKSPRTQVTTIDVRMNPTMAASDRYLMAKPGTDGAIALAIAHVMLTEGLWNKDFVGDFRDGRNLFVTGEELDPQSFDEQWTSGLIEWWNAELKDRTPEWAQEISGLPAEDIVATAREFGNTRPAMAIMERGPTSHTNGVYNGMAIHALNALSGAMFAEGGLFYQMGPSYGSGPAEADDYMDDIAREMEDKHPRIDMVGTERWPLADNMMQETAKNHLAGDPYKLKMAMFYTTNPVWTAPDASVWEEMLREIFVIETSPYPSETAKFADIVLPESTYLERLQDSPTYPFEGWPMTALRVPAVDPIYDTTEFGNMLIEIGKRIDGPTGDYYREVDSVENLLRHLAKGFEDDPGDNGVDGFEAWKEKGVWYKKPYEWKQHRGTFYEWDGEGYNREMSASEVADKLLTTPSGKFEFKSGHLEDEAGYISDSLGIEPDRVGFPQWIEPERTGGDRDLFFITPKTPMTAEGRSSNIPQAIALQQPSVGGNDRTYLEIHPDTARERGIRDGDRVRITSDLGEIEAYVRYMAQHRPDTVVLPYEHGHWAQGRWATAQERSAAPGNPNEITENRSEPISGLACYYTGKVDIERA